MLFHLWWTLFDCTLGHDLNSKADLDNDKPSPKFSIKANPATTRTNYLSKRRHSALWDLRLGTRETFSPTNHSKCPRLWNSKKKLCPPSLWRWSLLWCPSHHFHPKPFETFIGIYVYRLNVIFVVTSFALICSWLYILGNPYPELGLILLKLKWCL